jgi:hypothetical protein
VPAAPVQVPPDLRPLLRREPAPFAHFTPAARDALLSAAVQHGLLAAVEGRLPPDDPALRQRFERLAAAARLADSVLRRALEEALTALAAAGVSPVVLKGPALADRIYPDPSLRAATDLDLLLAEPELEPAAEALRAAGFFRGSPLVEAYQRRHHHHLQLLRPHGPAVELHFRAQSGFGAAFPTAELLARALPGRLGGGAPLRLLAAEDELLVLAVHGAAHLLRRGAWLLDLLLYLEVHPALDWAELGRRARAYRCARPLAWALARVQALGGQVPAELLAPLGRLRQAGCERLARAALARRGRRGGALALAFDLALRDRPWTAPAVVLREAGWVVRRRVRLPALAGLRPRPASCDGPAMAAEGRSMRPFWQPVRGGSMRPTLREGDEVLLAPAVELSPGDVVVVRLPGRSGTVLHRVVSLADAGVVTRGDACAHLDPPAPRTAVLFRALARRRDGGEAPIPALDGPQPQAAGRGEAAR